MFKKFLFIFFIKIVIFNSFVCAMDFSEEDESLSLTIAQLKQVVNFKEKKFLVEFPPIRHCCRLTYDDDSVECIKELDDEVILNGTWAPATESWLFSVRFPSPKDDQHIHSIEFFVDRTDTFLVNPFGLTIGNFVENNGEKLEGDEIKQLCKIKNIGFLLESSSLYRRFQLISKDGSIAFVDKLQDREKFHGIWSCFEEGWLFRCPFPTMSKEILDNNHKKILGVVFVIKEIFQEEEEEYANF